MTHKDGAPLPPSYYDTHADAFHAATAGVDMAPLHARFLDRLPPGSRILDAGCGTGRDALAFARAGYRVDAFDASESLVAIAREHTGLPVQVARFETFVPEHRYHGIWACASLLHVRLEALPGVMRALWGWLEPEGVLYVSFKHGEGERQEGERRFTDMTEPGLRALMQGLPGVGESEVWLTEDRRPERVQGWVNGVIIRARGGM